MAGKRKPARSRQRWRRIALIAALVLVVAAAAAFLLGRRWAPARDRYPIQGVSVSSDQGEIAWTAVEAQRADFAYIRAVDGGARDDRFTRNAAGAREAGLRYGAMLDYDLCAKAKTQATLFLATVPRDNAALPPVVRLDFRDDCTVRPARSRLLEALRDLVEDMESHTGKPVLIRLSHAFQKEYRIADGLNRTLWLEGAYLPPDYAGRPWVMWTANPHRRIEGVDGPVEWNVVRNDRD